jgi:hypothetical protein
MAAPTISIGLLPIADKLKNQRTLTLFGRSCREQYGRCQTLTCMNRFLHTIWLLVVLCCGTARPTYADRAYVPMGDKVRQAAIVALADTMPDIAKSTTPF